MQPILKYLFVAEFTDGTVIEQTPDDMSKLGLRNCYSDVLEAQKNGKILKAFTLNRVGSVENVSVNLLTGIFTINGLEVLLESDKLPALPDHFELIWYHQVTRDMNITYAVQTGKEVDRTYAPEFREYFIGWKCTIHGKSYQQKIAVA